jgi:hypothetical protein
MAAPVKMLLVGFAWTCALFWIAAVLRLYIDERFIDEKFVPKLSYKYGDAEGDLIPSSRFGPVLFCAMKNFC